MTDDEFTAYQAETLSFIEVQPQGPHQSRKYDHLSVTSILRKKIIAHPADAILGGLLQGRENLSSAVNNIDGRKVLQEVRDATKTACAAIRDESPILVTTTARALALKTSAEVVFVDEASQMTLG